MRAAPRSSFGALVLMAMAAIGCGGAHDGEGASERGAQRAGPAPGVRSPAPGAPGGYLEMPRTSPWRRWTTVNALPRVSFHNPVFAVMPPRGASRWYVGEREGRIVSVENDPAAAGARVVLDLRGVTLGWQDCGLLNMVFHPRFGQPDAPERGYFYIWYNYTPSPHPGPGLPRQGHESFTRLSRFTIPDGSDVADPSSELTLIEQHRTNVDHMGGGMFFHPEDGFLYLATGDGGRRYYDQADLFYFQEADDPQRIDRDLLSGVLRIDVDQRGGAISHPIRRQPRNGATKGYFIPNDNPWVDPSGRALEEFYAIGVRNPHRMTYDPVDRRVWLGDVGETRAEEIDLVERGGNYQWSYREGAFDFRAKPARILGTEIPPVHAYGHAQGPAAVIGGVVYRGRELSAEIGGKYVFGELGEGRISALELDPGGRPRVTELLRLPRERTGYGGVSSFAVDRDGEIYLCILGENEKGTGSLERLVRAAAPPSAPRLLSQTGAFRDTATLAPGGGLVGYEVNVPFWSGTGSKRRWIAVPAPHAVGFRPSGEWSFPPGVVLVKHFEVALDPARPDARRRLETRLLVLGEDGEAYGALYRWRADQTDAELDTEGGTELWAARAPEPLGPLASSDVGARRPELVGATEQAGDRVTLTASKGGAARLAYVTEPGDFDVAVRVDGVVGGRAGIMARPGLDAGGASAWVAVGPEPGEEVAFEVRGAPQESSARGARRRARWLRLRRVGGDLLAYQSGDGALWEAVGAGSLGAARPLLVGLAVAPDGAAPRSSASFSGATRLLDREHVYPSASDCTTCHNRNAGWVLGVNARQLHRPASGDGGVSQIVAWSRRGLLDREVTEQELAQVAPLTPLDRGGAPVEERVRSYLDASCSSCHRPGGVVQSQLDLRHDTPIERQGLVGGAVRWPSLPRPTTFIVAPKDPWHSLLLRRMSSFWPSGRMPPLGTAGVDTEAVKLVRSWIESLAGPPVLAPVASDPPFSFLPLLSNRPVEVRLEHPDPRVAIRYTLDGSVPTERSARYTGPLTIRKDAIVRARAFLDGSPPSGEATLFGLRIQITPRAGARR
jgi:glucose/arabinose dehydrogenase